MELNFDTSIIANYRSNSQIARLLTESWMGKNMYCPRCGHPNIKKFENNRPVADFFCPNCNNEYELKSKVGVLGQKINDGAYETMIERITGNKNPDFFFMSYSKAEFMVKDLILIPKHFFVPEIIERRKPLAEHAKRAGWIGCNIIIEKIPKQGRIPIISDGAIVDVERVMDKVNISSKIAIRDLNSRGWIMDILNCVNSTSTELFTLKDIYHFEEVLKIKYPDNHNIKAKIRQQLQLLRDKGFVEFLGNGNYKKIL